MLELAIDIARHQNNVALVALRVAQVVAELGRPFHLEDLGRVQNEHDPLEELGHANLELVVLEIGELLFDRLDLFALRKHAELELLRLREIALRFAHLLDVDILRSAGMNK